MKSGPDKLKVNVLPTLPLCPRIGLHIHTDCILTLAQYLLDIITSIDLTLAATISPMVVAGICYIGATLASNQ